MSTVGIEKTDYFILLANRTRCESDCECEYGCCNNVGRCLETIGIKGKDRFDYNTSMTDDWDCNISTLCSTDRWQLSPLGQL
jgi:hypothetical protein